MDELTGRTLGDFVVRHRLGEGGYGAVYRADQVTLGREAVIKVLHDRHRRSKTLIQRFLREARLASKLDHPYAAHIYAFGAESDGLMWIAMEFVKGQTLHEILRSRGAMPLDELVPLLDRICEVLQAAHDLGIVHRDIKPPNVMVVQRSGRAFPKLLDFGIAKLAAEDMTPDTSGRIEVEAAPTTMPSRVTVASGEQCAVGETIGGDNTLSFVGQVGGVLGGVLNAATHDTGGFAVTMEAAPRTDDPPLTEAGAALGSPPYMAPEQWGDGETTARTDLYALGVMTYEALVARRPFSGTSVMAFATAHATMPVPPLGGTLPAALDEVMQKSLAKQPTDRYASALEFAQAVRSAAGFGTQPLPALDDELRQSIEASFPQPIAEAVAAFHAARNPHQGRDALRDIVTTAIRYVAMIALAARAQVHLDEAGTTGAIAETVRELRRRPLRDDEWVGLARELVAAFRSRPQAHPMPELVALLHAEGESDALGPLAAPRTAEPDPLPVIRELLPQVTRLLRALSFLADYPLVVADEHADSWMGVRRPRRVALEIRDRAIEPGIPVLLDAGHRPIIVLAPIVQTSAPMPGAPDELFLLDGGGRRGARMVALPSSLERQDDAVWDWLVERFPNADRDAPVSPDLEGRPFRGLAAFTAQDADMFVGREREIDAAINRLNTSALIAVVGPSGAGKSSFVHAGVLPALPAEWTVISVRPGTAPIAALEAKLRRACVELADDARAMTVIVVDQFEELFTLGTPAAERRAYVQMLLGAAQTPEDNVRVVLALRDDFLAHATQMPELRTRLPAALFLLGTPVRADLVRILTAPLAKHGFDFDDPALPGRMVDEVAETPGALALLAFTATKLWELRDRHFRQLTRKAYDALGGVAGALAQHAETTLAGLSSHEQRLARTALGHLVTAEGTRAALTRRELDQLLRDPAAGTVLEKLVAARLLVTTDSDDGDDRVEIIHEALLVAWPRLARWRSEDLEGARLRDQVRAAARQWTERERPRGLLWRDDALAELQIWRTRHPQQLTDVEEAFVDASLAEATRGRRVRRGVIGVVIGLMAIAVAILVWARNNVAQTAARDRERVLRELVERGRQDVLAGNAAGARDALADARRLGADDTPELRFLERMAAQPIRGKLATLRGHSALVSASELSADGSLALTSSPDGTARLWSVGSENGTPLAGCTLFGLARFDPQRRRIAAECTDGTVRLYSADGRLERELAVAGALSERSTFSTFSADGTRLATTLGGVLEWWDTASGRRLWAAPTDRRQGRIAISPDARIVASMLIGDPAVTLWDAASGTALRVLQLQNSGLDAVYKEPTALMFDRSGARLFSVSSRSEIVQIWEVATGALVGQLEARAGYIWRLHVSSDGKRAVVAARNATQIWSLQTRTIERTLAIGTNQFRELAFGPGDQRIAAGLNDGSVAIWDLLSGIPIARLQGHRGPVWAVAFDHTGKHIISGGADMTATVWAIDSAPVTKVFVPETPLTGLELRGDRLLITSEHASVWNIATRTLVAQQPVGPGADAHFIDDGTLAIVDGRGVLSRWDLAGTTHELAKHQRPGDWLVIDAARIGSWAGPEVIVADSTGRRFSWSAAANVMALAFLAGDRVAIGEAHGGIAILDANGKIEHAMQTTERVLRLHALPDGGLASTSPVAVERWSATGQRIRRFTHPGGRITASAVDHTGTKLATTGRDGSACIWNLDTGTLVAELPVIVPAVAVGFSPDDELLVTLDDEGTARIWSVRSGAQLCQLASQPNSAILQVTNDYIVVGNAHQVVITPIR